MNRYKKQELNKYNEKTKDMTQEEKKIYDIILSSQNNFESMAKTLQGKLFPEEFDFMLDDGVDANRRNKGENPMSDEYIQRMDDKRVRLGFLPLSKDGYAQDSNKTLDYCKKLITGEIEYN